MYFISVLSCFTCHLGFQSRNEAVSVGWFPASEADRGDKFEQDLAGSCWFAASLLSLISAASLLLHNDSGYQERMFSMSETVCRRGEDLLKHLR